MFAGPKRLRSPEKRHSGLTSLQASGPQPNAGLIPCVTFFVIVNGVLRTLSSRKHAPSPLSDRLICATRFSARDLARSQEVTAAQATRGRIEQARRENGLEPPR